MLTPDAAAPTPAAVPLVETPAGLTAPWLSAALADWLGGVPVTRVDARPLGTGQMCDSLRLALSLADGSARTCVAKLPAADPTSRSTALALRSYEKEVRFYEQLAASLPVRTPALLHADLDVATAGFVLLLEDLSPAVAGDQLRGCTAEEALACVDQLVALHAPRWDDPALAGLDWLHGDPAASAEFLSALLPALWAGFRERYDPAPHVVTAGDALFSRLDAWFAGASARTVVHGDFRLDNLLWSPDGTVTVVDWQTAAHGSGPSDLAYFLGASLLPDVRREAEPDLLRRYWTGLSLPAYSFAACERDHRRGTLSGLLMAVGAAMMVERTERGDRMFLAMADRHALHALDLEAPDLLV